MKVTIELTDDEVAVFRSRHLTREVENSALRKIVAELPKPLECGDRVKYSSDFGYERTGEIVAMSGQWAWVKKTATDYETVHVDELEAS